MNKGLQVREGVKSSCSNGFGLLDKVVKILYKGTKLLRHYGTKSINICHAVFITASKQIPQFTSFMRYDITQLTTHNSRLTVKAIAFTLAETLIVMGVIGIVSALTLPNLNSSTGDKERVAKVKKIYQNLNDALGRAVAVYGPFDEWFINDSNQTQKAKRAGERITEFMKITKNCETTGGQGCFTAGEYKRPNGTSAINYDGIDTPPYYRFITADGMSIGIDPSNKNVIVDIDGPSKGSYTANKDLFGFKITDNGIEPQAYDKTFSELLSMVSPTHSGNWQAGAAWIIKFDNADYLKFTDNNGTCPNGTTVTEANPRCK